MNKKVNVYLMYVIIFLQGFVFYGPVAMLYRQSRNLSLANMFLIESISWILMIILEVPWGWFADKFGYKKTIVISNFIYFISKIVFYRANGFGMFFLERVMLSTAIAGLSGCDSALIYSSIEGKDSEKVFGIYNAFSTAGYLVASFIFTFLIKISMASTAFWTIIPYLLATVLSMFLIEVKVEHEEKPKFWQSVLSALKNKSVIILVISFALINEVVQVVSVFLNQSQYLRSGISIGYFGILSVVMQVVRLGSAKAYKFSEKLGKDRSIQMAYVAVLLCCIALIFSTNSVLTIIAVIIICGSSAIAYPLVLDVENKSIISGDRATLLSVFAMFGDVTAAGANIVIGKTADISTPIAFITCLGMCIVACVLLLVYKKMSANMIS